LRGNIKGTGAEIITERKLISLPFCYTSVTPPRLSTLSLRVKHISHFHNA